MKEAVKYLIIPAAGRGSRMNSEVPKQFLPINGKPIIIWTLEAFKPFIEINNMVVVISKFHESYWNEIINSYPEFINCTITNGGPTRFHSVKAGLKFVPNNCLVAIHDAARPLVSKTTIENSFLLAAQKGNAVPVIKSNDSLRHKSNSHNKSIDRDSIRIVQTPQVFASSMLNDAYQITFNESFTDDASVVEQHGVDIFLSEGNSENIKITTDFDFQLASIILSSSSPSIDME